MEGNFRIKQLSDCEFEIEKEISYFVKYPWYEFKKPTIVSEWRKVTRKGDTSNFMNTAYKATTLAAAKDTLRQIKKYPIIITE